MIGSLGGVVFEASSERVRTFRDLSMQRGANYAEHEVHGSKALLEFTGLALSTVSMKVRLDAALGVDPLEELDALRGILERHMAAPLILDGVPQGDGLWVVTSLQEEHEVVDARGAPVAVEVSLSLKEYV